MKRFYKAVSVAAADDGTLAVHLDGRPVKTPAKNELRLPGEDLARAVAAEWQEQGEEVDPPSMRLTRLANSAIDRVAANRDHVVGEIAAYAETDLLCYRASEPDQLAARQSAGWDPVLAWLADSHGIKLEVTEGVLPAAQSGDTIEATLRIVGGYDDFTLSGLHMATSATGSVVLGLAVAAGRIGGTEAWELSLIDETWQIEQWGTDSEATRRRDGLKAEIEAAAEFLSFCRGQG
ncbi:MAG: ATP12 family protein [Alphaproteobacteria bacterium]